MINIKKHKTSVPIFKAKIAPKEILTGMVAT